jgi:cytochrome c biogenesis protein CcdA
MRINREMSSNLHDKQKSLKRRFLLILGVTTLVCVTGMGLMVMFWDKLNLNLTNTQRYVVGGLFIAYGVLRFTRIFNKKPEDE